MGTSKGYIPPTRREWSQTKRAVTDMLKDRNTYSIAKVLSKYATAMKADGFSDNSFIRAAASILGLSHSISVSGVDNALSDIGFENLLEKPSDEILNSLLLYYTDNGALVEEDLAIDAISLTLKNLHINEIEKLGEISQEVILKEMLINYIELNFSFRYSERIGKDRPPEEKDSIIKSIQGYIRSSLYENLSFDNLGLIDFTNLNSSQYIENALTEVFSIFEELYTEE